MITARNPAAKPPSPFTSWRVHRSADTISGPVWWVWSPQGVYGQVFLVGGKAQFADARRQGDLFGSAADPPPSPVRVERQISLTLNPSVLAGAVRVGRGGRATVITYEQTVRGRRRREVVLPPEAAGVPDWRRDLASRPRRLGEPPVPSAAPRQVPLPPVGAPFVRRREGGVPFGVAATSSGRHVEYAWQVLDADKLIASHDPWTLQKDRRYPQELQPRERDRASYQDQIRHLALHLDPSQLMWSPNVQDGAPMVSVQPDGEVVVESGNGRVMAIKRAYRDHREPAAAYRAEVLAWADALGVPEPRAKPAAPVLVRVRTTQLDAAEFAREANVAGQQVMAAGEQALADAAQMPWSVVRLADPAHGLAAAANAPFVEEFVQKVAGKQSRGEFFDANRKLSQDGETRAYLALFAKAYGPGAKILVGALAEVRESDLRSFLGGMLDGAIAWARLLADVDAGVFSARYDLTDDLVQSALMLRDAREKGLSLNELRRQMDLDRKVTTATDLWLVAGHPRAKPNRTALGQTVTTYVDFVQRAGPEQQGGMFVSAPPSPDDLLRRAIVAVSFPRDGDAPTQAIARAVVRHLNDAKLVKMLPQHWAA